MARARDLGIEIGRLPPGPANAITDVDGVQWTVAVVSIPCTERPVRASVIAMRGNLRDVRELSSAGAARS